MVFHNSIGLSEPELLAASAKAKSQDQLVLSLFMSKPSVKAACSQIYAGGVKHGYWTKQTPITSIRRSVSNLVKSGQLQKLSEKRTGPMGMPEYLHQLNPERP